MQEQVITFATPVFLLLICAELIIGMRRQNNSYRLNDTINSISLGMLGQISGVFMQLLRVGIYAWLVQHISLFQLSAHSVWVWVSGLLLYDFCYYWLHRCGHQVNILWAAHVVHHQSEDYNLATALRQTSTGPFLSWIFYLPLALLGYPVEVYTALALIDLLYQFWVHTQHIGKLGYVDRVFVTPSNHRAHHGVNDIYLDKNYGGILILWDRLFGTFIAENDQEPVIYGTRSPLRSWDPIWANLQVYKMLWQDTWRTRHLADKLRIWIAAPGWRPADVAQKWPSVPFDINRSLFHPPLHQITKIYCLLQFFCLVLITAHFLTTQHTLLWSTQWAYAGWLISGIWIIGGILEKPADYVKWEVMRLMLTSIGILFGKTWFGTVSLTPLLQGSVMTLTLLSLIALWPIYKYGSYGHLSHQ